LLFWVLLPESPEHGFEHELLDDVHEEPKCTAESTYQPLPLHIVFNDEKVWDSGLRHDADQHIVGEDDNKHDHEQGIGEELLLPGFGNGEGHHAEHVHEVRKHEDILHLIGLQAEVLGRNVLIQVIGLARIVVVVECCREGLIRH
jgi:hypothetical protein